MISNDASRSGAPRSRLLAGSAVLYLIFLINSCGLFAPGEDAYLKNYAKGNELMSQGRNAKAICYFKKALKQNEHFEPIFQKLAICFQETGELDSAIVYFMGAIAHNPKNLNAYQSIEKILVLQGKYDEAKLWHRDSTEVEAEEYEPSPYSAPVRIDLKYLEEINFDSLQELPVEK